MKDATQVRHTTNIRALLPKLARGTPRYQAYCACGWNGREREPGGHAEQDALCHRREMYDR